jgi:hypothetical protein
MEIWSAVLLSAATVATAYSAYESTRWSGVQATAFTEAGANRTESAKANTQAFSLISIDANLFTQDAVAYTEGNDHLRKILEHRFFRKEFQRAFRYWVRQDPLHNPKAPNTPFQTKAYRVSKLVESDKLDAEATAKFAEGKDANQNSDDYVLATIFFAAVLFFAGIATKFHSDRVMMYLLSFGSFAFLAGLLRLGTLPFH